MLQRHARALLGRLLRGEGLSANTVALIAVAGLSEQQPLPEAMHAALDHQAEQPDPDFTEPKPSRHNQAPIPSDVQALVTSLAPVLAEHPAGMAANLASLWALSMLWPHAGSTDRPLLRTRWLNSLPTVSTPPGACLDPAMLRSWQREMPTEAGLSRNFVGLSELLHADTPQHAWHCLAVHLSADLELPRLGSALGSLAVRLLTSRRDLDGNALRVLVGATALERLSPLMPLDLVPLLASHLGHELWWVATQTRSSTLATCPDHDVQPLSQALTVGDPAMVCRAARAAAQSPDGFWTTVWQTLVDAMPSGDDWRAPLACSAAVGWRNRAGILSPDDAAALALTLMEATAVAG